MGGIKLSLFRKVLIFIFELPKKARDASRKQSDREQFAWRSMLFNLLPVVLFVIVYFRVENGNNDLTTGFLFLLIFFSAIISIESLFNFESILVDENRKKPSDILFIFFLVFKETGISFAMLLFSWFVVVYPSSFFFNDNDVNKFSFIITFFAVFVIAATLYCVYTLFSFRDKISILYLKRKHIEKNSVVKSDIQLYRQKAENVIDLFVILATVLLVAISLLSIAEFTEAEPVSSIYSTVEFNASFLTLAVYLQASYYKVVQILNDLKSD